jgi:hypothetical protein
VDKHNLIKKVPADQTANLKHRRKIQMVGAFNTGTNLVGKVISKVFNVDLHPAGHTTFWKHTCLTESFSNDTRSEISNITKSPNIPKTWYIVVVKHPYWWLHSIKRCHYSLKTINPELPIGDFIKQPIRVQFPRMSYPTDRDNIHFDNFVDYYNKFYNGCLKYLPKEQTIVVRYIDFLENPMDSIMKFAEHFPIKGYRTNQFKNNKIAQKAVKHTIRKIFLQPTKRHGNPRHGKQATSWYKKSNLSKLFKQNTYDWINSNLDENLLEKLEYQTLDLNVPENKILKTMTNNTQPLITIVIAVKGTLDIQRLIKIQLFLFNRFHTINKIIIIYAKSEYTQVKVCQDTYPQLNIELIVEDDICSRPNTINRKGWRYQQLLKLHAAAVASTPWYLIMDADCFPCCSLKEEELIQNGKSLCSMIRWEGHQSNWIQDVNKIIPIKVTELLLGVTPQILHTSTVKNLIEDYGDVIVHQKFTEYMLYWAYIQNNNLDILKNDIMFSEGIWKTEGTRLFSRNLRDELRDELRQKIKHIFDNFKFGLVQSNACTTRENLELTERIILDVTSEDSKGEI